MHRGSGVRACFLHSLRRAMGSTRVYLTIIVVAFVLWDLLMPIKNWISHIGYNISPWIFPFITSGVFAQLVIVGGLLFILCDAPFLDEAQPLLIVRTSRVEWCIGQLLYILTISLIYVLTVAGISALLMIPHIELDADWGKVIYTLGRGQVTLNTSLAFNGRILEEMTPFSAMATSIFYVWLGGSCLGIMLFLLNLGENRLVGNIATGAILLQDLFSVMILPVGSEYFSIVSLTRMDVLLEPDLFSATHCFVYSFVTILSIMMLAAIFSILRIRKIEIAVRPTLA